MAVIVLFVTISSIALLAALPAAEAANKVVVHDSDGTEHVMDLAVDGQIVVQTAQGYNVVEVHDGEVSIIDADCPNGNCMRQQPISSPGQQLICLPHKLWVEVVPAGDFGTQLDTGAVAPDSTAEDADDLEIDTVAR